VSSRRSLRCGIGGELIWKCTLRTVPMAETRANPRNRSLLRGTVVYSEGRHSFPCSIRDWSDTCSDNVSRRPAVSFTAVSGEYTKGHGPQSRSRLGWKHTGWAQIPCHIWHERRAHRPCLSSPVRCHQIVAWKGRFTVGCLARSTQHIFRQLWGNYSNIVDLY
jgi:hypothetical protein